ncbi:phospholipase A and acyltransferase 4-like [Salarias fasciatus]|uniref:phospholipase A and acyltransferase 4-like n=1 Tax=Salarias fasciatus TaxID=181472 RepID=UPI0011769F87|nr:phospholipase A and acyltransferase 4-like [Salarias fasciatus]
MGTKSSKNPEPGDLIEISRGGYQHWAVYVGDGYVVHLTAACGSSPNGLSSPPNKKALVKKEKLQDAVGTDEWKVNNILDKKYRPRPVDVIVREACAREGQELPYGIATRNCEHFATELRYGKAESQQVVTAFYLSVLNPLGLATAMAVDAIAHRVLKLAGSMSRNKKKRRQSHTLMQSPASTPQRS